MNIIRLALPARLLAGLAAALLVAGCGTLVDRPGRPNLYDLGPLPTTSAAPASTPADPIVLAEVEASGVLEGTGMLYRLDYLDDHHLRVYAQSRWSQPLPQLVRQRLADQLGRERVVLGPSDAAALARASSVNRVLRLELQEFAHHFDTPEASRGQLRLRATLQQPGDAADRVLLQRMFVVSSPAPSSDAAGGVRALAAALDAAGTEIAQWLRDSARR